MNHRCETRLVLNRLGLLHALLVAAALSGGCAAQLPQEEAGLDLPAMDDARPEAPDATGGDREDETAPSDPHEAARAAGPDDRAPETGVEPTVPMELGAAPEVEIPASGTQPQMLTDAHLTPMGSIQPTDDGYHLEGDLRLETDAGEILFGDAELELVFDEQGSLLDLRGETLLPSRLSEGVRLESPARATVGMWTGAQINGDPEFGIQLQPDRRYFVFLVSASLDIVVEDPDAPEGLRQVTLQTPAAGEIVIIMDPTDPFYYHFGSQPLLGEAGVGHSKGGHIPFTPQLPSGSAFDGHTLERGTMGLGFRFFDLFEISGTRVTHNPSLAEVDWEDPLHSDVEYVSGLNGQASFAFSVLGVGLFSFDLAQASAVLDVGLDHQSAAMQTRIAPDVSWAPSWFTILPDSEIVGDWNLEGSGDVSASLTGSYHSRLPAADLRGAFAIDNDGVTFDGATDSHLGEITLSASMQGERTTAQVYFDEDFLAGLDDYIDGMVEVELAAARSAADDYAQAAEAYHFELSLRGSRESLPAAVDAAVKELNALPATIAKAASKKTVDYIKGQCRSVLCDPLFGSGCVKVCLADAVDEQAIGTTVGKRARNEARDAIAPYVAALGELKRQAAAADSAALRSALRSALLAVYDRRTLSVKVKVNYNFGSIDFGITTVNFGNPTVYNKTHTHSVISESLAQRILSAANHVHRIGETSDAMLNAAEIVERFPTEEVFAEVSAELEAGTAQIPSFDGAGFTVEGESYRAFATLGGEDYAVGFNLLDWEEASAGVAELVARRLLGLER